MKEQRRTSPKLMDWRVQDFPPPAPKVSAPSVSSAPLKVKQLLHQPKHSTLQTKCFSAFTMAQILQYFTEVGMAQQLLILISKSISESAMKLSWAGQIHQVICVLLCYKELYKLLLTAWNLFYASYTKVSSLHKRCVWRTQRKVTEVS